MPIPRQWVTTAFTFDGYRIASHRGVVRGITVRSRNVVANIGASIQTLFGGNITLYSELCERAREEAFELMLEHAAAAGANAIIGMRYDANDVAPGVTEVLAYGTAVVLDPPPRSMLRTKRVYDPPEKTDGTRVLVMRLWPRGIKKSAVDLWLKDLGAEVGNLRAFKAGRIGWPEMRRRYLTGLKRAPAAGALRTLRGMAKRGRVTALCSCEDEKRCHRSLLRSVL